MSARAIMGGGLKTFAATVTSAPAVIIAAPTGNLGPRSTGGLVVKANAANTQTLYIGGADVSTTVGFPLAAGESISMALDDPSRVYAVAPSGTQNLRVMYV